LEISKHEKNIIGEILNEIMPEDKERKTMNQQLHNFFASRGFIPTESDYEELKTILALEHCSKNQRKFLDELIKSGHIDIDGDLVVDGKFRKYYFRQSDFETDLQSVYLGE
jgi:hypothetical protein